MEADSTTYDSSIKAEVSEPALPFNTLPSNLQLYKELTTSNRDQRLECQLVERLQTFGLLPKTLKCPTDNPDCKIVSKTARVVDRVQWMCEGCGKRLPIRTNSFFFRLQCSILQSIQLILAWSEDADIDVAAAHFGIKPRVATIIFDSALTLDELAIKEQNKRKLGGENSVVLAEMYPDCVNRLSPDTTDQPHVHRILMLADTRHIPTSYWLHVMKDDNKKTSSGTPDTQAMTSEVEEIVRKAVIPNSLVVTGNNVPAIEGSSSLQQLLQHCDADMQHFLSTRIWRQAVTVCCASRSVCSAGMPGGSSAGMPGGSSAGMPAGHCAAAVQRYLTTALYRIRHDDGFFRHVLGTIVAEYTEKDDS